MTIQYYDCDGNVIHEVEVQAIDHWDACKIGHRNMDALREEGLDPVDFEVLVDSPR